MKLTCKEAQKLITPYLEHTISPRECLAFLEHIEGCPSCREELETNFMIASAMKYLDNDENGPFNISELMEQNLRETARMLRKRHLTMILSTAVIGALVIVILYFAAGLAFPGILAGLRNALLRFFHFIRSYFG